MGFVLRDNDIDFHNAKDMLWEVYERCGGTPKEESEKALAKFAKEHGYEMYTRYLEEEDEQRSFCDYTLILNKDVESTFGPQEVTLIFLFDEDGVLQN